jgi:hypothetical protein
MCDALDGHAKMRRSQLKVSTGTRKKKKWWRWRSKELETVKIKGFSLK